MAIALEDDDLLWEILLRLPPLPSSLPRASAVCKRWRGIVTDPRFISSFVDHHWKEGPPTLGFFVTEFPELYPVVVFHPILDPPDSVPLSIDFGHCTMLGCRHGRILIVDSRRWELVVCAPITGEQQRVPIPKKYKRGGFIGSVMCAAGDLGHVHGTCHSGPFKVVLVAAYIEKTISCVYSSEAGAWGNLISMVGPYQKFISGCPGLLVGRTLYWLSLGDTIIEFDLEEQSLAVVRVPPGTEELRNRQIILATDSAIGFAVFSYPLFQTWQRNINGRGVATWAPWKTIQMHTILGLPPQLELPRMKTILCYDEDTDTIFLSVDENVYMVQLKSMLSKRLYTTEDDSGFYPFKSFYPSGTSITGGGANVLHDR